MKELSKKQIALRMTGVFVFVIIALIIAVAFLPGEKTQLSPRQALESSLRSTSSCSHGYFSTAGIYSSFKAKPDWVFWNHGFFFHYQCH